MPMDGLILNEIKRYEKRNREVVLLKDGMSQQVDTTYSESSTPLASSKLSTLVGADITPFVAKHDVWVHDHLAYR